METFDEIPYSDAWRQQTVFCDSPVLLPDCLPDSTDPEFFRSVQETSEWHRIDCKSLEIN